MADEALWSFSGKAATRNSCGEVLNRLAARVPNLIGGSADLAPSNKSYMKARATSRPRTAPARTCIRLACARCDGGAITNGLRPVIGGLRPTATTFSCSGTT
jgi:transketolase